MAEACGYCGRFMSREDFGSEYGEEWVCSNQKQHILDDPEHWSIYVTNLDIGDGKTWTGPYPADMLTAEQLRAVLDLRSAVNAGEALPDLQQIVEPANGAAK